MFNFSEELVNKQLDVDTNKMPYEEPINKRESYIDSLISGSSKINNDKKMMFLIKQLLLKQKLEQKYNEIKKS